MSYLIFITKYPPFDEVEEATYRLWELDAIAWADALKIPLKQKDRAVELKIACALSTNLTRTPDQLRSFTLREDGYTVAYREGNNGQAARSRYCIELSELLVALGKQPAGNAGYRDREWISPTQQRGCSCFVSREDQGNPFS